MELKQDLADEMWADAKRRCDRLENENSDLLDKIERNKHKIKFLQKVMKASKPNPCSGCGGRGEIKTFDGGDGHFEACKACQGSGRRKSKR